LSSHRRKAMTMPIAKPATTMSIALPRTGCISSEIHEHQAPRARAPAPCPRPGTRAGGSYLRFFFGPGLRPRPRRRRSDLVPLFGLVPGTMRLRCSTLGPTPRVRQPSLCDATDRRSAVPDRPARQGCRAGLFRDSAERGDDSELLEKAENVLVRPLLR
jgi:hypothetical protein